MSVAMLELIAVCVCLVVGMILVVDICIAPTQSPSRKRRVYRRRAALRHR
jgi:hypothetical protein